MGCIAKERICSIPAEDLIKEFYRPDDVQAVMDQYCGILTPDET